MLDFKVQPFDLTFMPTASSWGEIGCSPHSAFIRHLLQPIPSQITCLCVCVCVCVCEAFLDTKAHDDMVFIATEEEECVMAKILKQAESHEFNRGFVFYL